MLRALVFIVFASMLPRGPFTAPAFSQAAGQNGGSNPYIDPSFQDYAESSSGYLSGRANAGLKTGFRDSPGLPGMTSPASSLSAGPAAPERPFRGGPVPGPAAVLQPSAGQGSLFYLPWTTPLDPGQADFYYKVRFLYEQGSLSSPVSYPEGNHSGRFENFVFVEITAPVDDYFRVVRALSGEAGFQFVGERTSGGDPGKTAILGWSPYDNLRRISASPLVSKMTVGGGYGRYSPKTSVKFILKAPYKASPDIFSDIFLKRLNMRLGFICRQITPLSENSRIVGYDVAGSLPAANINGLFRTPFIIGLRPGGPVL